MPASADTERERIDAEIAASLSSGASADLELYEEWQSTSGDGLE